MQDPAVSALPKPPPPPRSYGCLYTATPPPMDLGSPAWAKAAWTEDFVDIEGPDHVPQPALKTRVKMLWDETALYIGAQMEEPKLWATLTKRDSVIFQDNDFEVFLDPDGDNHQYVELEINALNTVWDLLLPKPYRDGGPAVNAFDLRGLRTAVALDGELNAPAKAARGWSATIAIPWTSIRGLAGVPMPPRDGDRWRINFSRVEWDLEEVDGAWRKIAGRPEHNWVWSPQWAINMHRPETWGFLEFQRRPRPVAPDPYWRERCELMNLYYRQRAWREKHGQYAASLAELGLATKARFLHEDGFWMATVEAKDGAVLSIREDSRLMVTTPK